SRRRDRSADTTDGTVRLRGERVTGRSECLASGGLRRGSTLCRPDAVRPVPDRALPEHHSWPLVRKDRMARRIVDISTTLKAGIASGPKGTEPQITYFDHQQSVGQLTGFFPGLTKEELPAGEGWAVEQLVVSTHNGTHLDAPYHFHSTMDGGKRALKIG